MLKPPKYILSFNYCNLVLLYTNKPLKLYRRKVKKGRYKFWAKTSEGGIIVKGITRTGLSKK